MPVSPGQAFSAWPAGMHVQSTLSDSGRSLAARSFLKSTRTCVPAVAHAPMSARGTRYPSRANQRRRRMPERRFHHVSSAVVIVLPERAREVREAIAAMEGVEIRAEQGGRIVVVMEGSTTGQLG